MDHKLKLRRFTDARVVQAVRRLKSTRQKDDQIEVGKNQEDIKYPNVLNRQSSFVNDNSQDNFEKNSLNLLKPLKQRISSIKNKIIINNSTIINNNERNMNKNNTLAPKMSFNNMNKKENSKSRISIDGSLQKPGTSSTINNNIKAQNKAFDYETLKKYKKRKLSDYQRNLLSAKSLEKYKEEFVNLINKEIEIRNLLEKIGITKDNDYLTYITNNFFNKPHFLFTLEILILEAVEEANTLKVFRTNKNPLPLKVIKENYYRDEIIKNLKLKIYEEEYNKKYENLMKNLDNFMDDLKNKDV